MRYYYYYIVVIIDAAYVIKGETTSVC